MLLQQILEQLDAELLRLSTLRGIVADLAQLPAVLKKLTPKLDAIPPVETEFRELPRRLRMPRKKTANASEQPIAEGRTLTKAVPSAPVVVSAQELLRERRQREALKRAPGAEFPDAASASIASDALARDLATRWLSGTGTLTL